MSAGDLMVEPDLFVIAMAMGIDRVTRFERV
jgi:hypothetical protein